MKKLFSLLCSIACLLISHTGFTQGPVPGTNSKPYSLFIDVHDFTPGEVSYEAVMDAHQKDLAEEGKQGVHFIKFWVDEQQGKVYCLSRARDSASIAETHKNAHGFLPVSVSQVSEGLAAPPVSGENYFLDVHHLGAGNVTAAAVAEAHEKDLAVEKSHGVHFINYWVDEKNGNVYCLSEAPNTQAIIDTHKEAHGLLPDKVSPVKEGE